jgi:hypothetical protein
MSIFAYPYVSDLFKEYSIRSHSKNKESTTITKTSCGKNLEKELQNTAT